MPYEVFLAFRFLRSRHNRRVVRVTTFVAIVGIAAGVASLLVALALANGFRDEIRDKILRGTAHLTVMQADGQPVADYRRIAAQIANVPGVINATPTTYDGAVLIGPRGSSYAVLRGTDTRSKLLTNEAAGYLISGSFDLQCTSGSGDPCVIVGAELASRTGLGAGDMAEVVSATSVSNPERRRVRVSGIFRSGLFEYDSTWIYLPLDDAVAFSGGAHAATVISVQINNINDVKRTATKIHELLGHSYSTVDWQEANRPLFTALELERRMGAIIIGLIILIAVLNISTTLILIVIERRRDIAILNAMGATSRSIMSIFLIEGAAVGVAGALLGVFLGAVASLIVNRFKLISLPADVYSISEVPLNLNLRDVVLAALVAVVLSIIATIYPARAAAKIRPADLLRDA